MAKENIDSLIKASKIKINDNKNIGRIFADFMMMKKVENTKNISRSFNMNLL